MGWFLVTVGLPVLAPALALLCMRMFPLPVPMGQLVMTNLFKDGQLCWAAIGICVSALHDLSNALAGGVSVDITQHQWLEGGLIFVLVLSSLFAACGTAFVTPCMRPAGIAWIRHFSVLTCSLVLTLAAALGFLFVHFDWLNQQELP